LFSCEKTSALEEKHSLPIKVKWSCPHSYRIKYADSLEAHDLVKYILESLDVGIKAGAVVGGVILLGGVSMVIFYVWHVKTK
jgi:hypothetical protein